MHQRFLSIILLLFTFTISAYSQFTIRHSVVESQPADSADIAFYSKKRGWLAASEIIGLNMGLWGFNRYIAQEEFAYIDWSTIKNNFKRGFVWDNDQMGTNMFLHPYHGNLYYNAARSNGYNYWESGLFALGGSAMWELCLENEYPSINDIIATPIGGMALGETLYRTSDLILDDRTKGRNRFGREFASFLIAPTRGLTRIINGDAWRRRATSGKQFGKPDVSVEIGTGPAILELEDKIFDKGVGWGFDINIEYGDWFASEMRKPYDYFSFRGNFTLGTRTTQLNIIGRLHVTDLVDTEKDYLSLGFYQHFDYFDSDTISLKTKRIPYKFGTPASVGTGFVYQNKRHRDVGFNAFFHANLILLGAALSDHYVVDMRNYNLASGFSTKLGFNLSYKDKFSTSLLYEMYRMFTWKGYPQDIEWDTINIHNFDYQGDRSQAILHFTSLRADLKLSRHLYLTGIFNTYTRDTNYKYFEDVFSKTIQSRFLLSYKF